MLLLLRHSKYGEVQCHEEKVAVLEDTVEKLEQERAAAMSQAVNEEQQHKVQEALDWFAAKISVFSKEEQEAINACTIAFAERDQMVIPKVNIAVNAKCSQADLMAYASSAFFKIGKKRKDIAQFLCTVFERELTIYWICAVPYS